MDIHATIFAAWKTLLATITTANGYLTNVGAKQFVFRSSDEAYGEDELPCQNVFYDVTQTDAGGGCADCVMKITVECLPASAADEVAPVESIRRDVQQLVMANQTTTTGLWYYAEQNGSIGDIETDVAGRKISGITISFSVNYSTKTQ